MNRKNSDQPYSDIIDLMIHIVNFIEKQYKSDEILGENVCSELLGKIVIANSICKWSKVFSLMKCFFG